MAGLVESIFDSKKKLNDFFPYSPAVKYFDLHRKHFLYGKIDRSGDAVIVEETNLKATRSGGKSTNLALNFVSDAFEDFKNSINKFNLPVVIFVDTPGAYPGVGAEERGQAEAIAKSIECSLSLGVPTISIIIGEGGSGGAIALASSNKILMFENAIYSVISPEGCASILWRDPKKTLEAATAMKLTSKDLLELKIIDEIISEPIGGAHRERDQILLEVKKSISRSLGELTTMSREDIIEHRKKKFLNIGRDKSLSNNILSSDKLFSDRVSKIFDVKTKIASKKIYILLLIFSLAISFLFIFELFFR